MKSRKSSVSFNLRQTFISTTLVVLALTAVVPLYQVEKNMFETRMVFNPSAPESKTALYEFAFKGLQNRLLEPSYKVTLGTYLAVTGFTVDGLNTLKEVVVADKRNLDALTSLAEFNQQLGNLVEVNKYRSQIAQYDPFNAANYLQLGRNYKSLGDIAKMNEMRVKIMSFAPETEEAKQANLELN
jgi:tetratricopeptide (TPR) repeat protein